CHCVVRLPDCFFFSSRRRHTRSKRDWSSDVCSSDLAGEKIWDVNRVHEGLLERFGAHSWYPIGPAVRDALTSHHGVELAAMPLADRKSVVEGKRVGR